MNAGVWPGLTGRVSGLEGKVLALEFLHAGLEGQLTALVALSAELQAKASLLETQTAEFAKVKATVAHLERRVSCTPPAPGDQSRRDAVGAPHQHEASAAPPTLLEADEDAVCESVQWTPATQLGAQKTQDGATKPLRVSWPDLPAPAIESHEGAVKRLRDSLDEAEREVAQGNCLRALRRRIAEDSCEADGNVECVSGCQFFFVDFVSKGESDNDSLGIYVETMDDCIVIGRVKPDGHISRWNEMHPERRVLAQDEIVEVNGKKCADIGAWQLKEMLKGSGEFSLRLRRKPEECHLGAPPNVVRRGILKKKQT